MEAAVDRLDAHGTPLLGETHIPEWGLRHLLLTAFRHNAPERLSGARGFL